MSKKFFVSFILLFFVGIGIVFAIGEQVSTKKEVVKVEKNFSYRKYLHVKNFYRDITKGVIEISLKYNIPPSALLAIAGVESGYGRGYVGKITGNILSLGAKRGEAELPALYLPNLKSDSSKVVYGDEIQKYKKDDLVWKQRPKSLKKDYRPKNIASSVRELDYFDKNPKERVKANLACMEDFAKNWISLKKKFKPFVDARVMLDELVDKKGKDVLFDIDTNIRFIYMISGKDNSFNYRKTWAPKVVKIMKKAGLIELVEALHVEDKKFDEVW